MTVLKVVQRGILNRITLENGITDAIAKERYIKKCPYCRGSFDPKKEYYIIDDPDAVCTAHVKNLKADFMRFFRQMRAIKSRREMEKFKKAPNALRDNLKNKLSMMFLIGKIDKTFDDYATKTAKIAWKYLK